MPVRYEDMIAFLGEGNVILADRVSVSKLGLPAEAQRVLVEVGLPREAKDETFSAGPLSVGAVPGKPGVYCRFGHCSGSFFAVELATGQVWAFSLYVGGSPPGFVNSSMTAFVECLLRYLTVLDQMPDVRPDPESQRWADLLEQQLLSIDPQCVQSDTFYSEVIEDIRIGI